MPRASKKATPSAQNEPFPDILTFFDAPGAPQGAQTGQKAAQDAQRDASVDLTRQIAALTSRLDAAERAVLAPREVTINQPAADTGPKLKELDLSGLPDPWAKPDEYTKEFNRRQAAVVQDNYRIMQEYDTRTRSSRAQSDDRFVTLWEDFKEQNPQFEGKDDQIAFVAQKVAQREVSRGVDPNRYMFQTSGRFFDDVKKEYEKVFGKTDDAGEAPTGAEPPPNRTAGVFGGMESGGKPSGSAGDDADDEKQPPTMIDDLKTVQRAMKLF